MLYVIYPRVLEWSFIELPSVVRWAGAGLVLLLIPFIVSAQRALGRNVSPTVMTHGDHELVTDGPYRWIRNPLYTAGAILFTGLGLISASAFLLVGALVALVLVAIRLPSEEAELEKRFGQAYRDYVVVPVGSCRAFAGGSRGPGGGSEARPMRASSGNCWRRMKLDHGRKCPFGVSLGVNVKEVVHV